MAANWSVRREDDGSQRVVVVGELDLAVEQALVDDVNAMLDDGAGVVLLDLGSVGFIDSSGVRAILRLRLEHGDRVRLGAASAAVARVIEIAGLSDRLNGSAPGER